MIPTHAHLKTSIHDQRSRPLLYQRAAQLAFLLTCLLSGNPDTHAGSVWTEDSFETFRDGSFLDGGSNLYVSSGGRVQVITRWDLNQDGFVDLVVPSGHSLTEKENTTLYLNRAGEIDARTRIDLPGGGSSAGFVADLNRDGLNDLIVANYTDSHVKEVDSWVYWGTSEGFTPHQRAELPAFAARSITSGDYNGDGWEDLAIACQWREPEGESEAGVSLIYWNSPDGFHPNDRLALPLEGEVARFVLTTDLDHDGIDDLLVQTAQRIHLFKSSGRAFESGIAASHLDLPGETLALGDFNGDGLKDLAIAGRGAVVVLTAGPEGFNPGDAVRLKVSAPRSICGVDLNRDGHDDLVVANYQSEGGATWTDSLVFYSDQGRFDPQNVAALPTLGANGVSAGDLDGDGYPELVFSNTHVTNLRSLYSYIYWNKDGQFRFGNHSQLPTTGSVANAIGDVDNDGLPDVVFFNEDGGLRDGPSQTDLFQGDGTRDFAAKPAVSFLTHQLFGIGHADLDDDGHVDLVFTRENFIHGVAHEQSGISVHWGSPDGFQRTSEITTESSYGGVRIADINRDGFLDLLTGGTSLDPGRPDRKGMPIYWGSANGFLRDNRSVIPSRREKTRGPLLADLDRDGWLDVVAQEEEGTFSIWKGSPDGFDPSRRRVHELGRPDHLMYIKAADLNRDGWLDLLLPQRGPPDGTEASSFIYFGGPDGFSDARRTTVPSFVPYQNTIADLDRDGWLDLVLTSYGGEVSGNRPSLIHWGTENGFRQRPRTELPTYGSSGSLALDFDRDGWLDLFFANHRQAGSTVLPLPHRHNTVSMLYWGGPDGFSVDSRTDIPSRGPSGLNLRDPGNTYDRGFYEDYLSSPHRVSPGEKPVAIDWMAETPFGAGVHFQIRGSDAESGLDAAVWTGPDGPGSWWLQPGPILNHESRTWIQYRARLHVPHGGVSPLLSRVTLQFEQEPARHGEKQ